MENQYGLIDSYDDYELGGIKDVTQRMLESAGWLVSFPANANGGIDMLALKMMPGLDWPYEPETLFVMCREHELEIGVAELDKLCEMADEFGATPISAHRCGQKIVLKRYDSFTKRGEPFDEMVG